MSLADDYARIQHKLITIVRGDPDATPTPILPIAQFYKQVRDKFDRVTIGDPCLPSSVEANEMSAQFALPERNRRDYRKDKTGWNWELRIDFNENAILSEFEEAVNAAPIMLRALETPACRQVSLELLSSSYQHQVAFGAKRGTRAIYVVQAKLWPL